MPHDGVLTGGYQRPRKPVTDANVAASVQRSSSLRRNAVGGHDERPQAQAAAAVECSDAGKWRASGGGRTGLGAQRERRVWSVDETAHLLGISCPHTYELIARNVVPHIRLGRRIVVPERAVEHLLDPPSRDSETRECR